MANNEQNQIDIEQYYSAINTLEALDYKTIKMAETTIQYLTEKYPELLQLLPYNINEIIEEKNNLRQIINDFQE